MPSIDIKAVNLYKKWETEIQDALKREKDYRIDGRKVVDIYEGRKADDVPFAILYSNTEVLVPAVYNSRPIPIVERRFKDADPLGKLTSEVSTRTLKYLIDNEAKDYDSFDDLISPAVLEALLVNRGLSRFKYQATDRMECVYGEAVRWDKFFHGYARTWKKVPWIGFEWDMSEADVRNNFKDSLLDFKGGGEPPDDKGTGETKQELTGVRTYKVYEIWDKATRKVYFFSGVCPTGPLREIEDPLEIGNFFPMPKPLNFMRKVTTLVPTPLYTQYRQQAKELNDITLRLRALIKAIKVRGAYNSTIEGIEKMLEAGDNELVPVENMASMPENAGIDRALYIVPINDLVQAVQTLYQQREQVKQVIYEITGISDILRGASVASETATAQNIKNQWGTLRLKKMQKEVQRYCREALAIMLEIAAKKFDLETFQKMTGLQIPTNQDKQQAQMQLQQMQMQAQQQAMMAQQQGQQPQPPPEPPAELLALLQAPTWEDVLGVFHDEVILHYKIDIETNSTIDAEASQDKQDISELLNAISQFLNGVAPLVEQGILPMEVAKSMLLTVSRRFNFGSQLEDALEKMQSPPQKGPDPAEQAKAQTVQMQAQVDQARAKADLEKINAETQQTQVETQGRQELLRAETELKMMEVDIKRLELQLQQSALNMKATHQTHQHSLKMQMMEAQMNQQQHQVGIQSQQQALDQQAQDAAAEQQEAPNAAL